MSGSLFAFGSALCKVQKVAKRKKKTNKFTNKTNTENPFKNAHLFRVTIDAVFAQQRPDSERAAVASPRRRLALLLTVRTLEHGAEAGMGEAGNQRKGLAERGVHEGAAAFQAGQQVHFHEVVVEGGQGRVRGAEPRVAGRQADRFAERSGRVDLYMFGSCSFLFTSFLSKIFFHTCL